jgi:DNA-binding CsgD family transcriptional regulator
MTGQVVALTALSVLLIGALNLSTLINTIIVSCLMLLSCFVTRFIKDENLDHLMNIDFHEKERHNSGPYNHRIAQFFYLIQGIIIGVEVSLLYIYEILGDPLSHSPAITLLISAAMVIAGSLLLIFRFLYEFTFEKITKSYLAFTCALGFIAIPFVSVEVQGACLIFLMALTAVQFINTITAFIERVSFEELSPLWYMGEYAFIFAGIAAGVLFSWFTTFDFFGDQKLTVCCFLIILITSFSQVIIDRAAYPQLDFYEDIKRRQSLAPAMGGQQADVRGGKYWKRKLAYISRQYNLSPRQSEVFELLARGRDVTYLTSYFDISQSTAKTHVANIYQKMDVHSRQEILDIIDTVYLPDDQASEAV